MNSQESLNILAPLLASSQVETAALQVAMDILRSGYVSDRTEIETAIKNGVAAGIDSAVKIATDPLNAQIADLQAQIVTPPL